MECASEPELLRNAACSIMFGDELGARAQSRERYREKVDQRLLVW
jgi:hypothetical protein